MSSHLQIDGSQGEGGGQILRTALALSAICQAPIDIRNIRAQRKKPGLRPQHLTGVKAMADLCEAEVTGAREGSDRITFAPRVLPSGEHVIDIGTAGSTALLLHTLYYPMLYSGQGGHLLLKGGTHNEMAPSFPYLQEVWSPLLHQCGLPVDVELRRFGFYPKGGGQIVAKIPPYTVPPVHKTFPTVSPLPELDWTIRPAIDRIVFYGIFAEPGKGAGRRDIPERMARAAQQEMHSHGWDIEIVSDNPRSASVGAMACMTCYFGALRAQFTVHGERGVPAETLGKEVAQQTIVFLASGACLDPWAADQVLLPLALSGRSAQFTTSACTEHLTTNADIIQLFLPDCTIAMESSQAQQTLVKIRRPG